MELKKELEKKINEIKNSSSGEITTRIKKLYHFNTVENFSTHLDKINSPNQIEVYETLVLYLKIIENKGFVEIGQSESKRLYNQHINPIALKYYIRIGFATYARPIVIYSILIIILLILFSFESILLIYILVVVLFMLLHYRIHKKTKQKMVYGYRF